MVLTGIKVIQPLNTWRRLRNMARARSIDAVMRRWQNALPATERFQRLSDLNFSRKFA